MTPLHSFLLFSFFCCFWSSVHAANFSLTVHRDPRRVMDLGVFGYGGGGEGKMVFHLKKFLLREIEEYSSADEKIGFTLDLVNTAMYARQERNYAIKETKKDVADENVCFVDDPTVASRNRFLIPLQDRLASVVKAFERSGKQEKEQEKFMSEGMKDLVTVVTIPATEAGLYALFFYNCKKANKNKDPVHVSFTVDVSQYNVHPENGTPSFLSVGEEFLPYMDLICFAFFLAGTISWHRVLYNSPMDVQRNVRGIHKLMYVLAVLKCVTLLLNSIMLFRRRSTGKMNGYWDYLFYFFQTLKGVALFTVIVLLGTGWSLLKPFLSERDKKLFIVLIPLQLLVNIALAVIEQESEGTSSWSSWRDMLRLMDIGCCVCVLLPVVWSIKNLRDSAGTDGRAKRNLNRLKQFRTFYIAVVVFIYFTRLVIQYVENYLPFRHIWVSHFLYESAALTFYTFTASKFQPTSFSATSMADKDDESEVLIVGGAAATTTTVEEGENSSSAVAAAKSMKAADIEEIDLAEVSK